MALSCWSVDGSSEAAFAESLQAFQDKLSPARRYVFGQALKDIWVQGTRAAEAERREYTAADYYRQIDGLAYEQVVHFTDPTGETAKVRYRAVSAPTRMPAPKSPWPERPAPIGFSGEQLRGGTYTNPMQR